MTQQVPDLLPPAEMFAPTSNEETPSPFQVLQRQGELLSERTQGEVEGLIDPAPDPGHIASYWFTLYAPALEYRYRLFLVQHGTEPFPLELRRSREGEPMRLASLDEFYQHIRDLLVERRTTQAIRQMRQLVQESRRISSPAEKKFSQMRQKILDLLNAAPGNEINTSDLGWCEKLEIPLDDYDLVQTALVELKQQGRISWYREGSGEVNNVTLRS